jgi:hypothetical protein
VDSDGMNFLGEQGNHRCGPKSIVDFLSRHRFATAYRTKDTWTEPTYRRRSASSAVAAGILRANETVQHQSHAQSKQ